MNQPLSSNAIVNKILKEVNDFETHVEELSDNATFSHYETLQTIVTLKNKQFQTHLKEGEVDDRLFHDIITPAIDSAVANTDRDSKNFTPITDSPNHLTHALLAKAELNNYFKKTRHGVKINDIQEKFFGDGNIVARKVKDGEIYKAINLLNLMPLDVTAETLEDTDVIEKQRMNQTQLRKMKEWKNIDKVVDEGNLSKSDVTPEYEVLYRRGEITKNELEFAKSYLNETEFTPDDKNGKDMVQTLVIVARSKDSRLKDTNKERGFLLFAEKADKEIIKVNEVLKIERYKPYAEAHLGAYNGRWLREGYYEKGRDRQFRANELGNQIRMAMKLNTKLILWSKDSQIAGKNILKSIKDGQIIKADDLNILNNAEKNLAVYATQWNQNIDLLQKDLKSFETATGETSPGNTSATEIVVTDRRVGKYYGYKGEKLDLFFEEVFNRWVLPTLMDTMNLEHNLKVAGDLEYMEQYFMASVNAWYTKNMLAIGNVPGEVRQEIMRRKLDEMRAKPEHMMKMMKDFYKDVKLYVYVNASNDTISEQGRVTNGLALLKYITNPTVSENPQAMKILSETAHLSGFNISNIPTAPQQQKPQRVTDGDTPQVDKQNNNENETRFEQRS